jgi:hypothetical protein
MVERWSALVLTAAKAVPKKPTEVERPGGEPGRSCLAAHKRQFGPWRRYGAVGADRGKNGRVRVSFRATWGEGEA